MNIPEHLYDPVRLDCALTFLKKRLRKFFPNISDFREMEADLERRRKEAGQQPVDYEKLKSFWDRVYALKFETSRKSWIRYLTAENYKWELVQVPTDQLQIMWPTVLSNSIPRDILGEPPYTKKQFDTILEEHPEYRTALEEDSQKHSAETSERDHFPVVGVRTVDGVELEDGNRRTRDAFLFDKPTMDVWVGECVSAEVPEAHWLPTSWFWHQLLIIDAALVESDTRMVEIYSEAFCLVLKRNPTALFEFEQMQGGYFITRHQAAYDVVKNKMIE